jgi:hypothetical protein
MTTVSKRKRTLSPEEKAVKEAKSAFTKAKNSLVKGLFKADDEDITDEKLLEQTLAAKKAKRDATDANKISKEEIQSLVDMCLGLWKKNPDDVPAEFKPLFETVSQAFEKMDSLTSQGKEVAEIKKMVDAGMFSMDEFRAFIQTRHSTGNTHEEGSEGGSEEDGEINTDL